VTTLTNSPDPTPDTVDNPPSSNTQSAASEADTQQSGALNGNVSVRVGQGGSTGPVGQQNDTSSTATSSATGNLPESGADPSASANATTSQDTPSNSNVDVRIDSPGDVAPVNQQNSASASATASGTTASDRTGGGGTANASATQTSPNNVNVVVRVGSPGDNGGVTQQNSVGATAGPKTTTQQAGTTASSTPGQTDQVVSTVNGGADVTNTANVSQQLVQTQDGNGPNVTTTGIEPSDPSPVSTIGSATATQTGAQNINVSIRVGSPGSDANVSQQNGATATGTSDALSVVAVTGGSNLDLSVVIPGSTGNTPGSVWSWNWLWTSDGTPAAKATASSAAPTGDASWSWLWTPPAAGATSGTAGAVASTAGSSAPTPPAGQFSWNWIWKTPDGQTWSLTQTRACECTWTWTWNWDWSAGAPSRAPAAAAPIAGAPAGDAPAATTTDTPPAPPSVVYDEGPVSQTNTVTAVAAASADVTVTTLLAGNQVGVDPALELQDAQPGQSFANDQSSAAYASADQLRPLNVNSVWGVPTVSVTQSNTVAAAAAAQATATLDQELIQGQDATDGQNGAYQWLGAQQTASNTQTIEADAVAAQDSARNENLVSAPDPNQATVDWIEQGNSAQVNATVSAAANLVQQLAQFEDAFGPGVELIDLTQVIGSIQTALVQSVVAQTRTQNADDIVVPKASRATNPTLRQENVVTTTASSENTGNQSSVAFQYQGGVADIELTSGLQTAELGQTASVYAPAQQADLKNSAGWLGIEPPLPVPPPVPVPDGGDTGGATDASAGGSNDSGTGGGGGALQPGPQTTFGPFRPGTPIPTVRLGHASARIAARPSGRAPPALVVPPALQTGPPQQTVAPVSVPVVPGAPFLPPAIAPVVQPAADQGTTFLHVLPASAVPAATAPLSTSTSQDEPRSHWHEQFATVGSSLPLPWTPENPQDPSSAGTSSSASAPSAGSGQSAGVAAPYKLAAQLVTGPREPTSVLGRPVIFLEPFERPG
jgi:hypothetical protein